MPAFDGIFVGCLFAGASVIAVIVLIIVLMSQKTEKDDIERGEASPPMTQTSHATRGEFADTPSIAADIT